MTDSEATTVPIIEEGEEEKIVFVVVVDAFALSSVDFKEFEEEVEEIEEEEDEEGGETDEAEVSDFETACFEESDREGIVLGLLELELEEDEEEEEETLDSISLLLEEEEEFFRFWKKKNPPVFGVEFWILTGGNVGGDIEEADLFFLREFSDLDFNSFMFQ